MKASARIRLRLLSCAALILLACPAAAFAYVDPGAGSMLLQLILGGVAGVLIFGRLLARRILRLFGLGKDRDEA